MPEDHRDIGVVVAKRKLKSAWMSHAWLPVAVLPGVPTAAPWTRLRADDTEETFYAGPSQLSLYSGETAHYRDNLASDRPSVWVALRPSGVDSVEVATVTVDPYEGEALVEGMGDIVEAVPMPSELRDWIAAFIETFHVERQFFKRRRDRANLEGLGRREPKPRRTEGESSEDES